MNRRLYLLAAGVFFAAGLAAIIGEGPRLSLDKYKLAALDSLLAPAAARAADVPASATPTVLQPAPAEPLPSGPAPAEGMIIVNGKPSANGGRPSSPVRAEGPVGSAPAKSEPKPLTIYMPKSDARTSAPSVSDSREAHSARRVKPQLPELHPVVPRRAGAAALEPVPQKQAAPVESKEQFLPRPPAEEPSAQSAAESQEQLTATPQATPFATHEHAEPAQPSLNLPSTATDQDAQPLAHVAGADDGAGMSLRWVTPTSVTLGQEATCQLIVRNTSSSQALAVLVEVHLPRSVAAAHCEPAPKEDGQFLTWELGNVPAGASKTLQMGLRPTEKGPLTPTAAVTCTRAASASIEITEPKLELNVAGPKMSVLGQMSNFHFRAQNTGSGSAANVVLELRLSDGLQHAQGPNPRYRIGTLEPGESRQVQVPAIGMSEGQHAIEGVLLLGESPAAKAQCAVDVVRPTLDIAFEGPKLRYVDRKATYVVKVQNPGPAPIENVQLLEHVPEGFRFVEASSGGSFDRSARQVAWFVGRLEPNESASVGIELIACQSGEHRISAAAKADEGVVGKAEVVTRVESVPSVTLDVSEDDDPVEVDTETVYRIRVTNHGTRPATHVQVAAEVPQEMQVLKLSGPAVGAVKGQEIVFPPLATLEPGKSEEYQVRVQCRQSGQVRFRAFFRSDDTPNAVIEEEHTRVYGDEGEGAGSRERGIRE